MRERHASRTAVFVCQGRAVANGLIAPDVFADPFAVQVLAPEEIADVETGRLPDPPAALRERMTWERMRAIAEVMVPRTVAIDAAVRDAANPQVVIVGAGLDCRPWRMPEIERMFSLDHPTTQAETRRRTSALPQPEHLTWVAVDLAAGALGSELRAAGHDPDLPTTWIWEGVVPYLTRDQVASTMGGLAAASRSGSTLIVSYQSPSLIARIGRFATREPWRSLWSPARMAELLSQHHFRVTRDDDLLEVATGIGSPARRSRSLSNGRIAVAVYE